MKSSKEMPYHIGLKMRLYPSAYQKHLILVNDNAQRAAYNKLVAVNNEIYQLSKTTIYVDSIAKRIDYLKSITKTATSLKNALPFLYQKEVDSSAVLYAMLNYRTAWKFVKSGCKRPIFHKKSNKLSYQTDNHYDKESIGVNGGKYYFCDNNKAFKLPKLGKVSISCSKKMIDRVLYHEGETRISTMTISKDSTDRYYLTLLVSSDKSFVPQLKPTNNMLGIDMNISNLLTDSKGNTIPNPTFRKNIKQKIAKEQKKLALMRSRANIEHRDLSTSKNYQKQRKYVAELYRYSNARMEDYLHCISKKLIESQDWIFIEDLNIKDMLKNHNLAFAISDVSWGKFFFMLSYKANWYDRYVVPVSSKDTTQTCSYCKHTLKDTERIPLGVSQWVCPSCGRLLSRDHNAARNILNKGIEILS